MPVLNLFSSRTAAVPDVQVQIANIIEGALGSFGEHRRRSSLPIYEYVAREIAHEHGRSSLTGERHAPHDVLACMRREQSAPVWLDVVELSFRLIERFCGKFDKIDRTEAEITIPADQAVEELNERDFAAPGSGSAMKAAKSSASTVSFSIRRPLGPLSHCSAILGSPGPTMNFALLTIT
jgi:hypothetical protein